MQCELCGSKKIQEQLGGYLCRDCGYFDDELEKHNPFFQSVWKKEYKEFVKMFIKDLKHNRNDFVQTQLYLATLQENFPYLLLLSSMVPHWYLVKTDTFCICDGLSGVEVFTSPPDNSLLTVKSQRIMNTQKSY